MAPRIRTVESAGRLRIGDTDGWQVITRADDGSGRTHLFPAATLEWRAAEFGIDPGDAGALVDMVLHEQLMEDEESEQLRSDLAGVRSTAAARQAHAGRLAALRARTRIVVDGDGNPLNAVRAASGITVEGVREKRQIVDVNRWTRLYGGLPVPPVLTVEASRA